MRKTKEILRLAQETDLTNRQIARSVRVSPTTVGECIKRAEAAGIVWPFTEDMDEAAIEELLYPEEKTPTRPLPDMKHVHTELSRKGVTLALLWQEYARDNPGDHYSSFDKAVKVLNSLASSFPRFLPILCENVCGGLLRLWILLSQPLCAFRAY